MVNPVSELISSIPFYSKYHGQGVENSHATDLSRLIPDLKFEAASDDLSLTQLLDAVPLAGAWGWMMGSAPVKDEKTQAKEKLKSLVEKEMKLKKTSEAIEKEIAEINKELDQHEKNQRLDPSHVNYCSPAGFASYKREALNLLQELQLKYLGNHKEMLENLRDQESALQFLDPNIKSSREWDAEIETLETTIQGLTPEKQAGVVEAFLSAITEVGQAVTTLALQAVDSVESSIPDIDGMAKSLFGDAVAEMKKRKADYLALIQIIEEQGMTEERLIALQESLATLQGADAGQGVKEAEQGMVNYITGLLRKHSTIARALVGIFAVSAGTLVGGPIVGFAAKTAADKIMTNFEACDTIETQAQKIASAISQAIGAYIVGGTTAAAVAGGQEVFKEVAPENVQKAVETGAFGYTLHQMGVGVVNSVSLGLGTMLALRNLALFSNIKRDIKHAFTWVKEHPLRFPLDGVIFARDQVVTDLKGTVTATVKGKRAEAITRAAVVALTAIGIASSYWALPIALGLFYLTNKVFQLKFEGPATLNNAKFREFVIEEMKERKKAGTSAIEALKAILIQENEEFKRFCDAIDTCTDTLRGETVTD